MNVHPPIWWDANGVYRGSTLRCLDCGQLRILGQQCQDDECKPVEPVTISITHIMRMLQGADLASIVEEK